MRLTIPSGLVIVVLTILYVSAEKEKARTVSILDAKSLQTLVMDTFDHWLIAYSGPDHNIDPFLENVSSTVHNYGVSIGKVDCSKDAKQCRADGVRSMPSLRFITGAPKINPYSGKSIRDSEMFSGEVLDMRSLQKFISKSYPASSISKVTTIEEIDKLIGIDAEVPTAVIVSDKTVASLMFRSIAEHFKGRIGFAFIQIKSAPEVVARYNIVSSSIGLFQLKSTEPVIFQGEEGSRKDIVSWLSTFTSSPPNVPPKEMPASTDDFRPRRGDEEYASSLFSINTLNNGSAWLVGVLEVGADIPDTWSKAKRGCVGHIESVILRCHKDDLVVTVDVDAAGDSSLNTEQTFGQQACRQAAISSTPLPFLLAINHGEAERKKFSAKKFKFTSIILDFNLYEKALKKLGDSIPASAITNIYENMLTQFANEGYAKGLISILLLSDSPTPPALFKNVALSNVNVAQFGFLTAPSPGLLKDVAVKKLPYVLSLLPPPDDDESSTRTGQEVRIVKYMHETFGPVKFDSLSLFVTSLLRDSAAIKLREVFSKSAADDTPDSSQDSLTVISSEADWNTHCGEQFKGICVVGLLAPSAGGGGVLVGSDALDAAMKGMKKSGASFRFLSIDAICHTEFSESFGIQSHELPTLIIYSPSKSRYQTLKGSYSENSIKELAQAALTGRVATIPMSVRPKVAAECSASPSGSADDSFTETVESSEDAEEFLREIKREEAIKAAQLKQEIKEEQQRILEEEMKKSKKKSTKKKKKSKSKKTA